MILALLVLLAAAPAENSAVRLAKEQRELRDALLAKCPKEKESIAALENAAAAQRTELLLKLEQCGAGSEAFLVQLGNAQNVLGKWADAEATFRKALGMRVTESALLGELTAISRQKPRTDAQKARMKSGLEHFKSVGCTRDDLCAGLSYVAWHEDEEEIAATAGEMAIKLGYSGWQPYFTAGTVYATKSHKEDRARAIELLTEAKKRGGPAKDIDGFLERLGVK
jgi:hypothetical protein